MAPILTNVLAKLQVMRHIKRDVIYGPKHLKGMGFKNVYSLLGVTHVFLILQFYNINKYLG